jgi:hypothetical protein
MDFVPIGRGKMRKGIWLVTLCLLVFVGVRGDTHYKYIHSWDADTYFGHIIYPEAKHDGKDAVVLREGLGSPEVADLNLPIAPGDTIRTSERRCEIQFDTGTIIRLDRDSELKIETILAQSLSSKTALSNLLLSRGQAYIMYKRYIRKEIFQIITPNAAVKLNHKSVAMIHVKPDGNTDVFVKEGKAHMLFGTSENAIQTELVKKPEMITVTPNHELERKPYEMVDDFEEWNGSINKEFHDLHDEKSVLPLPIQKLPKSVFYFAQKYGQLYGEWLWHRYYGYVWRPFLNDRTSPWGRWMPYYYGRWTSVQGQLFWVPREPWGWVPYHLGIWMWNKKKGWLWIPGSVFAPAWVDWSFHRGFFCWRPWSILDWYGYAVCYDGYLPYFAHLIHPDDEYNAGAFQGMPYVPPVETNRARRVITKEQLKQKPPPLPMPKEFKDSYKRVVAAVKNGEDGILAPLKETPNHMFFVSKEDLNATSIHEKIAKLSEMSNEGDVKFRLQNSQQNPHLQARQVYSRNEKMATLREKVTNLIRDLKGTKGLDMQKFQLSRVSVDNSDRKKQDIDRANRMQQESRVRFEGSSGNRSSAPVVGSRRNVSRSLNRSSVRFRDWNPDVKVARRAGISIRYSSRSNEVKCPELNISSRHVMGSRGYSGPRVQLSSRGSITASSLGGGSVFSGGSSSGSSSRGGSSDSSSSSSGSRGGSSGGAKGGVVKK